jgi:hypothetical protein
VTGPWATAVVVTDNGGHVLPPCPAGLRRQDPPALRRQDLPVGDAVAVGLHWATREQVAHPVFGVAVHSLHGARLHRARRPLDC